MAPLVCSTKASTKIMKVDVFQTTRKDTFLFLPQGAPFSSVPRSVLDTVGLLQFFNTMDLVLDAVGAKHSEIRAELEKQGYSVHKAQFKITEHESG
jgi:uncharacterized protein YcgL (UPF0745 family)